MTEDERAQLAVNTIRTLKSGHPGTPMALAPLVYRIWNRVMSFDPQDPIWPTRDRFVLSNGRSGGHWKDVTKGFRMRDETMKTRNAAARFRVPRWILTLPERSTSRSGKAKAPF